MPEYLAKYREIKGWIPSTDIDEIDAVKSYARDVENVDFENGFVSNAAEPVLINLHSVPQSLVEDDWELLKLKYYYHSEQGDVWFYTFYKHESATHLLRFFVNDTELNIDEQSDNIIIDAKPTNISFNLVNDQLKINLNVKITYSGLEVDVIGNLTLVYLKEKVYDAENIKRAEGWYLFPRWLGWTYDESITLETTSVNEFTEFTEDFEDALPDFITLFGISVSGGTLFTTSAGFYNDSTVGGLFGIIGLGSFRNARKLSFDWGFGYVGEGTVHLKIIKMLKTLSDDRETIEASYFYTKDDEQTIKRFEIDLNILGGETEDEDSSVTVWIGLPAKSLANSPFVEVKNIKLEGFQGCLVTKNSDGQRSLVVEEFDLPLCGDYEINFDETQIDWRVTEYELYAKYNETYRLFKTIKVEDGWDETAGVLTGALEILEDFDTNVTTLVFNYALGATVKVFSKDEDELIGDYIYKEVFYRGRSYYVKNDQRVYHSHLSGTGRPQPDSFPFDEDVSFGFVITYSDEINKALAVTLLDELVVITEKKNYVYTLESTGGIPYRKIKAVNGGAGISNANSLIAELNGAPVTKVLIWFDNTSIFAYIGGREAPISITGLTHRNYWRLRSNKASAIIFYNRAKNEYWVQIGDDILIYEIDANSWKKYSLDFTIKDFVGIKDNYSYIISTEDKLYKIDPDNSSKMEGMIEFHDNVLSMGEGESTEIQTKILHDVYLSWKDEQPITAEMAELFIIVDDNEIDQTLKFPINYRRFISRSPYQVSFGRIRYILILPASKVKFKELGYVYSILPIYDSDIPGNFIGYGMEHGGEHGVVL